MDGHKEAVQRYLENLLASNSLEHLDSWMHMISTAEVAARQNNYSTAEELYKIALRYAEEHMSDEVVINALLCLSSLYRKLERLMESQTAYERAVRIFERLRPVS